MLLRVVGEEIELLPEKAIWWPRERSLVVADTHFGKDAVFRARQVPVPCGNTDHDLRRLGELLDRFLPKELLILGDFWHGKESNNPAFLDVFANWRRRYTQLRIIAIEGNHDKDAGPLPPDLGLESVGDWLDQGPIRFSHHPRSAPDRFTICGHLHPVIRIRDAQGASLRCACFHHRLECLVMPAFGSFTGGAPIKREPGDRVFLIGQSNVIEWAARNTR